MIHSPPQALIKCMDDPVARCQSHACAAFVNLGEELPQETMLASALRA